jgi:hypothetical protein
MALDQSALLDVLDALKVADVGDRVRSAAETIYQALIEAELTETVGAAVHECTDIRTCVRILSNCRPLSGTDDRAPLPPGAATSLIGGRAIARKQTRRWSVGRRLMWSPPVDDALPRAGPLSGGMNPPRCVRPRPVTGGPSISSPARPDSPPDEPDSKLAVEWTVGQGPGR